MLTLTTCVASFVLCYYVSSVVTTMPTATSTIRHASSPPPPTTPSTTVARNKTTMLPIATSTTGQICLQCDETVHPHTCSNVIMCGGEEICFVDSFVNPMGGIRCRLGCRDRNLCSISGKRELSSSTANRHTRSGLLMHDMRSTSALSVDNVLDDSRTSLVCSQCCNGSLCNTGGCGVTRKCCC
ncbi:uncharacterized protein LOC127870203 [Dreissena polymorpha]|uniref:uncharacterized protein LOC127870203 n=1 Tax=Dreissena polymorpha TaxID=45954 RepID=UPI002265613D|nr:uncharacterized protein LOC127870203 [Dreissena polymorpha]